MYAGTDDTLESVAAIELLIVNGVHNQARRECRFLLEQSTKHLYVDQQLSDVRVYTREDRIAYLGEEVPRSSIEPIFDTRVYLGIDDPSTRPIALKAFQDDIKDTWAKLSGYVHPSREQLLQRAKRAAKGSYIGFETARDVADLVSLIARVYDQLAVMWLEAAGPSATGDILVWEDVPGWPFAKAKWLPQLSASFDYKVERQDMTTSHTKPQSKEY